MNYLSNEMRNQKMGAKFPPTKFMKEKRMALSEKAFSSKHFLNKSVFLDNFYLSLKF